MTQARSRSRSTPSRASATSSPPRRRGSRTSWSSSTWRSRPRSPSQDIRGKVAAIRGDAAARDRGADRPAHRPQRAAHRLRVGERARPLAAGRHRARGQDRQEAAGDRGRRGRREPGGRVARARSRWSSTARGSRPTTSRWREVVDGAAQARTWTCPAGSADRGATEALVRVAARGRSAADIARIPVKRAGATTRLRARRRRRWSTGWSRRRTWPCSTSKPALALDVLKQSGANTVAVADGIAADGGQDGHGAAARASPCRSCATTRTFIRDSIHDVNLTMIIGGILTVLIVFAVPELLALHRHHRPHPAHLGDRGLHRPCGCSASR